MDIWLTTTQVADLVGVDPRTIRRKALDGTYTFRISEQQNRGGQGGSIYEVLLDSLPAPVKRKFFKQMEQQEADMTEEVNTNKEMDSDEDSPPPNLAELKAVVGQQRFNELMKDAENKAAIVNEYLQLVKECTWGKASDIAVIVAERYGISTRSLYRMVERFKKYGTAGLLKKSKKLGKGTTRYSICKEIDLYFRKHWLRQGEPTVGDVITKMGKYCRNNSLKMPSAASIYRLKDDLEKFEPDLVCLARIGEEAYIKQFGEKATRQEPKFVNQIWEGDHHRLDFFGLYEGKPTRFWLTAWEDVTTRAITGITLSIQANGRTIGLALRHGILNKELPILEDDISPAMKQALENMEWSLQDLNEKATQSTIPFTGLPMCLYIDNGEDYKAKLKKGEKCQGWDYESDIKSMCELLNVETLFCTPYSPYAKGHLERWFATLCEKFSKNMPGYCGKDNKRRPERLDEKYLASQGKLLTMDEILFLIQHYLWEYHNTVHRILGMTPYEKYEQTLKGRTEMPDPRTLDIALMDYEIAMVTNQGIRRFGTRGHQRVYKDDNSVIMKYVGQKVVIRYDPNHIGELLVFEPRTGAYVCTVHNNHYMAWDASMDDKKELEKRRRGTLKTMKQTLKSYGENTIEAVIEQREASGEKRMATGNTKDTVGELPMITGVEKAAKEKEKASRLGGQRKKPNSVFDEFLKNAGQM